MPVPVAPLVGFALGVVFAWAAEGGLAAGTESLTQTRAFAIVALFAILVFGPAAGYFVTYETDWSFAYLADARRVPSALLLAIVLGDIVSVPVGFVVGARLARKRRTTALLPWATVPMALAAVTVAVLARRLSVHGSYAQFKHRFGTVPLAGSQVGWAILWFGVCVLAGAAITARELRRPPSA